MKIVRPRECLDHRVQYIGQCPFCLRGMEPTRILEARADFIDLPVAGYQLPPDREGVMLEDAVKVLGLQLAEVARIEAKLLEPVHNARRTIIQQVKQLRLDPLTFQRAARIHAGLPGADTKLDEHVEALLELMRR